MIEIDDELTLSILLKSYWNSHVEDSRRAGRNAFNSSKVLLEQIKTPAELTLDQLSFNSSKVLLEQMKLIRAYMHTTFNSSKVLLEHFARAWLR